MQGARTRTIRIQTLIENVTDVLKLDASPIGDCHAIAGITSEDELFIEIYKSLGEGDYEVRRIIFDWETTQKIRLLFRREHQ